MNRTPRKDHAHLLLLALCTVWLGCAISPDWREPLYHEVRAGETFDAIAAAYDVDPGWLASANAIRDPDRLQTGQRLLIPGGGRIVHVVRPGETLGSIAARYQRDTFTIAQANGLPDRASLAVGTRLVMPPGTRLPAAVTPARAALPDVAQAPPLRVARTQPSPPVAAVRPTPRAAPDTDLVAFTRLLDTAAEEYLAADFHAARDHAIEAGRALAGREGPDAARLRARAAFVEGSASAGLGEDARAIDAFARSRALAPDFEPPVDWMSPRLEALYEQTRRDHAGPPAPEASRTRIP